MTQEAAVQSNFEMEQALGPYVDAVSVEASKWARCVIAFAFACVRVRVRVHVCVAVCCSVSVEASKWARCVCVIEFACACACECVCVRVRMHAHTHMHMHTHMCLLKPPSEPGVCVILHLRVRVCGCL